MPVARLVRMQHNAQSPVAPQCQRFQQRPKRPAMARVKCRQSREQAVAGLVAPQDPRLVQRHSDGGHHLHDRAPRVGRRGTPCQPGPNLRKAYPSRGRAAALDTLDCGLDDRVALRGSAGGAVAPAAVARRAPRQHKSQGNSAGPSCSGCRPRTGHHNARNLARRRPGPPATNSEKLDAAPTSADTARTSAAHFDECFGST